jgi:putative transposase
LIGTPSFHERGYELKRRGISLEKIVERVSGLYGVEPHWIMVRGGEGRRVATRSLLCYWAVRELGMTLTDLARTFGMSPYS